MLFVAAVVPALAQEAEDIRGPKPLIEIPPPELVAPWWAWVPGGLMALAVVALVVWLLRRKKQVVVSAEEWARKELDQLRREGESMPAGVFAEAASGVLRRFIERRFGVAAPRRTTEEFLHEVVAGSQGLGERVEALRVFLRSCDLAKFAGEELDKLQREDLLVRARGFVNEPVREQRKEAA